MVINMTAVGKYQRFSSESLEKSIKLITPKSLSVLHTGSFQTLVHVLILDGFLSLISKDLHVSESYVFHRKFRCS